MPPSGQPSPRPERTVTADLLLVALHGEGGHRDDRDRLEVLVLLDPLGHFQSRDLRQLNIHQNQIGLVLARDAQRVHAVLGLQNIVAARLKQVVEQLHVKLVILDHQNSLGGSIRRIVCHTRAPILSQFPPGHVAQEAVSAPPAGNGPVCLRPCGQGQSIGPKPEPQRNSRRIKLTSRKGIQPGHDPGTQQPNQKSAPRPTWAPINPARPA